jgi:hypothetical protein
MGASRKKFVGNLPEGMETTDVRKYVASWRDLANTISHVIERRVVGYEPGVGFEGHHMPIDICLRLYKAFTGREFRSHR